MRDHIHSTASFTDRQIRILLRAVSDPAARYCDPAIRREVATIRDTLATLTNAGTERHTIVARRGRVSA